MQKTILFTSIALALAACGGGGGGTSQSSKPNYGSNIQNDAGDNAGNTAGNTGGNTASNTGGNTGGNDNGTSGNQTKVPVPTISTNPTANDSKEMADAIVPTTNKLAPNKFGAANTQGDSLNLKDAYDQNLNGAGVKLGMIDGAVNINHPALTVKNVGTFSESTAANNEHGTKVAMIMTGKDVNGNVYGIAKGSELIAASNGDMNTGATLRAMYALQNAGVKIINNSYASEDMASYAVFADEYLNAKTEEQRKNTYIGQIKQLTDNGVLLVFGAGNSGKNQPSLQSLLPKVDSSLAKGLITVVGVSASHKLDPNSNACGDAKNWCMAANWQMYMGNINAQNQEQYERYSATLAGGTSIAAPQVSAAAALVKQKYAWFDNDNLRTTLLTTADDIGAKGVDGVYGWGMLNIGRAVNGPAQFAFGDFKANVTGQSAFDNAISGTGGLIKNGSGSLKLNANNTYTGNTQVNQGELVLNAQNRSNVNVAKAGTLTLGANASTGGLNVAGTVNQLQNGTVNINSDFVQQDGSTLNKRAGAVMNVAGRAQLDGTLNITQAVDGYVTAQGVDVEVLNAAKGVSGNWDTISGGNGLLTGKATVSGNKATVNVKRGAVSQRVTYENAEQTAKNIDAALMEADKKLELGQSIEGKYKDVYSTLVTADDIDDVVYSYDKSVFSTALYGSSIETAESNKALIAQMRRHKDGLWFNNRYSNTDTEFSGIDGTKRSNTVEVGGSKVIAPNTTVGGQINVQNTEWENTLGSTTHSANMDGAGFSLSVNHNIKGVDLFAVAGFNKIKGDVMTDISRQLKAKQYNVGVGIGKEFNFERFAIAPSLMVQYIDTKGDDIQGVIYDLRTKQVVASFAVNAAYALTDKFMLTGSLGIDQDLKQENKQTVDFLGQKMNNTYDLPKTRGVAKVGVVYKLNDKFSMGANYRYSGSSKWNEHSGDVFLRYDF